jgi:hypothetical protein
MSATERIQIFHHSKRGKIVKQEDERPMKREIRAEEKLEGREADHGLQTEDFLYGPRILLRAFSSSIFRLSSIDCISSTFSSILCFLAKLESD